MIVKDILVNNNELFINELIVELIRLEISYVRVEDEVHFLDRIYRFKSYTNSINEVINIIDLIPTEKALPHIYKPVDIELNTCINDDIKLSSFTSKSNIQKNIKCNNMVTNNKIKSYIKNRKF